MSETETRPHAVPYARSAEELSEGDALNEAQRQKLLDSLETARKHCRCNHPFTSNALERIAKRVAANEAPYSIGVYVAAALQEMEALLPTRVI